MLIARTGELTWLVNCCRQNIVIPTSAPHQSIDSPSNYADSEIGTNVSDATYASYLPVNRVQLTQQTRGPSPARSGGASAGSSAGQGGYGSGFVTRLD